MDKEHNPSTSIAHGAVLLTVEEAARCLAIGRTTAYGLITTGRLESVLIGAARRVPADAVVSFVGDLRAAAAVVA